MFEAGWQVLTAKFGYLLQSLFAQPGGDAQRDDRVLERLVALASEHFESAAPGERVTPDPPPATHARIALRNKKALEQVHLCLGVPSYPLPHQERFACYVLNTLLGGGMSSRLFQNIRERQGLAYAVFSELNPYRDTGCLSIYAGTSIDDVMLAAGLTRGAFYAHFASKDELFTAAVIAGTGLRSRLGGGAPAAAVKAYLGL